MGAPLDARSGVQRRSRQSSNEVQEAESIDGAPADVLVASLDVAGLAVSSGSACQSGAAEPSHVLVAMGRTSDAVVRFSLGWTTTEVEVERGAMLFLDVLDRAKGAVA